LTSRARRFSAASRMWPLTRAPTRRCVPRSSSLPTTAPAHTRYTATPGRLCSTRSALRKPTFEVSVVPAGKGPHSSPCLLLSNRHDGPQTVSRRLYARQSRLASRHSPSALAISRRRSATLSAGASGANAETAVGALAASARQHRGRSAREMRHLHSVHVVVRITNGRKGTISAI
jgi:hypothetical protein